MLIKNIIIQTLNKFPYFLKINIFFKINQIRLNKGCYFIFKNSFTFNEYINNYKKQNILYKSFFADKLMLNFNLIKFLI